jgi:hypothetical protein
MAPSGADLPLFGGQKNPRSQSGKDGEGQRAVSTRWSPLARFRAWTAHPFLPPFWAVQGAAYLPQHAQCSCAHRHPLGMGWTHGTTSASARFARSMSLSLGRRKPAGTGFSCDGRGAARWVLSRQRGLGSCRWPALSATGAKPTDAIPVARLEAVNARILVAFRAEGADAWYADGRKKRFLGNAHDPEAWETVETSSMFGSRAGRPTAMGRCRATTHRRPRAEGLQDAGVHRLNRARKFTSVGFAPFRTKQASGTPQARWRESTESGRASTIAIKPVPAGLRRQGDKLIDRAKRALADGGAHGVQPIAKGLSMATNLAACCGR